MMYSFNVLIICFLSVSSSAQKSQRIVTAGSALTETAVQKVSSNKPLVVCIYNRGAAAVDMADSQTFSSILDAGAENAFKSVSGFKALRAEALVTQGHPRDVFTKANIEATFCCRVNVYHDPCTNCPYFVTDHLLNATTSLKSVSI
jgi:hypothetical protein